MLAGKNYTEQYQSLDPDVYYVKLDDDTMYVGEQAIDMMLHEKLRDRFFIVSANVINHSGIHWLVQYLCLAAHHLSCCSTSVLMNSLQCKIVHYKSTLCGYFLCLEAASQTCCCLHWKIQPRFLCLTTLSKFPSIYRTPCLLNLLVFLTCICIAISTMYLKPDMDCLTYEDAASCGVLLRCHALVTFHIAAPVCLDAHHGSQPTSWCVVLQF